MLVLFNYLVPASQAQLAEREVEISRNVTAKLLTEGTFLHPADRITFYIRDITPEGQLRDVFMSDRRSPRESLTYTANEAYIVRDGDKSKLVMLDGLSQTYETATGLLYTTHFADFAFDISALIGSETRDTFRLAHALTPDLITAPERIAARAGVSLGEVVEALHMRFAQPLLALAAALIGFSALLVGGFSRFGIWKQIVGAIFLLVLLKLIEGVVTEPVRRTPSLFPLLYLPGVLGLGLSVGMLWWSARPRRIRQKAFPPDTPPPDHGGVPV